MSPRVLRRKLQKKLKHKPYRKCPCCGRRADCFLFEGDHDGWHLVVHCGRVVFQGLYWSAVALRCLPVGGCGYARELFWSGGGTADA